MKKLCTADLLLLLTALAPVAPAQETVDPLWRIGLDDDGTAEFAHAPDRYQDYRKGM